jgi:hyperosmotically inducible periplasmic protein
MTAGNGLRRECLLAGRKAIGTMIRPAIALLISVALPLAATSGCRRNPEVLPVRDADWDITTQKTPYDAALGARVRTALQDREGLDASSIAVHVEDASGVTLTGSVPDREQADLAIQTAMEVEGVEVVFNRLEHP